MVTWFFLSPGLIGYFDDFIPVMVHFHQGHIFFLWWCITIKYIFLCWNEIWSRMCFLPGMIKVHFLLGIKSLHYNIISIICVPQFIVTHRSHNTSYTCITWLICHFSLVKLWKFVKEIFVILKLMRVWKNIFGWDWCELLKLSVSLIKQYSKIFTLEIT